MKHVLYVEDDLYAAEFLEWWLKEHIGPHIEVHHYTRLVDFKAHEGPVDCVVSDINFPAGDGTPFGPQGKKVKAHVRETYGPEMPLVFISGDPDETLRDDFCWLYRRDNIDGWRRQLSEIFGVEPPKSIWD